MQPSSNSAQNAVPPIQKVNRKGIIFVSPGTGMIGGGMGTVTNQIVNWLNNNQQDLFTAVIDSRGNRNRFLSVLYTLIGLAKLIWYRIRFGADILHVQVSERGSFLRKGIFVFLGRTLGMSVILHHHGAELIPFLRESHPFMRNFVGTIVRHANVNITLGKHWHDYLMHTYSLNDERVLIVHNATADAKRQPPTRMRNTQAGNTTFKVLMLANLTPRKGVTELLNAITKLHNTGMPIEATLAGGGEIERYKKQARVLGIEHNCNFPGWLSQEQVYSLLADTDIFVLPSYEEGLPMSILEALSAEIPIVTTPVGSIPEVLTDEQTCLFVAPHDHDTLAKAISRLYRNKKLAKTLAKQGRQLYEREFTMETYMARIISLYNHVPLANNW